MNNQLFRDTLIKNNIFLTRRAPEILQVNIGRLCNLACHHCHVEAGPKRVENMESKTVERLIELLEVSPSIHTVDLTGGAPELNPNFRRLVTESRRLKKSVIDRCNLTVLYEPGQEGTAQFMRDHQVQIIASLPCYSKENVEKQRGQGVFNKSIEALKTLNKLGYAQPDSGLKLDLVYNPTGPYLPPKQEKLQADYKKELWELFEIQFDNLYAITNMPIKRFLRDLERNKKLDDYMNLLVNNFNPQAAAGVMCRNLVSVAWNGDIFDCDFNQMLEIPLESQESNIWNIKSFVHLKEKSVALGNHCFACTAGSGSSCHGALA